MFDAAFVWTVAGMFCLMGFGFGYAARGWAESRRAVSAFTTEGGRG